MNDPTRRSTPSAVALILAATIVSGGAGYIVIWLVASRITVSDYAAFAIFWSTLYLVVGSLGGVQQEVTRASSSSSRLSNPSRSRSFLRLSSFALTLAVAVFLIVMVSGAFWGAHVFLTGSTDLLFPLALGAASYFVVACICGALYGQKMWLALAVMISIDGVMRLIAVLIVLGISPNPLALGWATSAPFPLAIVIVLPWILTRLRKNFRLDVNWRDLFWNVIRTIAAAAATATMISGFPLLLRITSPEASPGLLAPLILVLTLTRAPIVIPLMSLQSYLIVVFTEKRVRSVQILLKLEGFVVAASAVLATLAGLLGPTVLGWAFGDDYRLNGWVVALLVASSGLIAALCVTGPLVLSRSDHSSYTAGWLVAAALTLALLVVPGDINVRAVIALTAGPLVGLIIHGIAIARLPRELAEVRG